MWLRQESFHRYQSKIELFTKWHKWQSHIKIRHPNPSYAIRVSKGGSKAGVKERKGENGEKRNHPKTNAHSHPNSIWGIGNYIRRCQGFALGRRHGALPQFPFSVPWNHRLFHMYTAGTTREGLWCLRLQWLQVLCKQGLVWKYHTDITDATSQFQHKISESATTISTRLLQLPGKRTVLMWVSKCFNIMQIPCRGVSLKLIWVATAMQITMQLSLSLFIYIYIYIYTYTYTHTYIHTYIHACMHACIHACIHTYIHTYMHTYIQTYIHTHIHTYTYTRISVYNYIYTYYIYIYVYIMYIYLI